jgi:hypothetical protein
MNMSNQGQHWHNKISNSKPLGGIESSILDNGAGLGVRVAWLNTGSLRYKIVIDRSMDIAEAFFNEHCLSWVSHSGVTRPEPFSNHGLDWLKTFGGGLLATCGLSHTGGPEADQAEHRGLHGEISNIPAEIESIIQPDPVRGQMNMSITGIMRQTRVFGPSLELKRKISGTLGNPSIKIDDIVTNLGNEATPLMLLYHFNLGWPLADEGADILWNGSWVSRGGSGDDAVFNAKNNFRKCPAPLESHNGSGEAVAFIDTKEDGDGNCCCGLFNEKISLALSIRFKKAQLPWLTNWQHWGKGEYVTGLEPGTHQPVGQNEVRRRGDLTILQPGESKAFNLELSIINDNKSIQKFIQQFR